MNIERIKEIGGQWKTLDDKYDNLIAELIDKSESLTTEQVSDLKAMQKRLFNLETELLDLISPKAS